MTATAPSSFTPDPACAGRAIGAMFLTFFGGAWIGLWAWRSFEARAAALAAVAAATFGLFAFVYGRYRRHRTALAWEPASAAERRRDRWFHAINAGQWIAILVIGNVLANIGLSAWVIPAAMFIVGLHFLPLARLFGNPPYYVTGGALMLLAAAYPFAAPAGALGAGAILWASALWGVRRNSRRLRMRCPTGV